LDFLVPHGHKYVEERILMTWQKRAAGGSLVCMIEELNGGAMVGLILGYYVDASMTTMEIAIALKPEVWNRGYGTETLTFLLEYIFNSLGVHRVEALCMDGNTASTALFRKLGFVEEVRLKEMFWVQGAWADVFTFAMLEEEWFSRTSHPCHKEESIRYPEVTSALQT